MENNSEELVDKSIIVTNALIEWINEAFTYFKEEPLNSLRKLSDPVVVFSLLNEM